MVAKFIGIVKQQLEYWKYQVAYFGPDHPRYRPAKIAKYEYLIRDFTELLAYLETQSAQEPVDNYRPPNLVERFQSDVVRPKTKLATIFAAPPPEAMSAVPDDLADLPPELLNELSESIKGEIDPLIAIINGRGGTATLDEILIDLWRKYKELGKRPIISNKLYRLSKRGLCWPLPGKKGVYTTTRPNVSGDDTSSSESDDGSDTGMSEPPSNKPETSAKPTRTASSKARRDLFASTAISSARVPQ